MEETINFIENRIILVANKYTHWFDVTRKYKILDMRRGNGIDVVVDIEKFQRAWEFLFHFLAISAV